MKVAAVGKAMSTPRQSEAPALQQASMEELVREILVRNPMEDQYVYLQVTRGVAPRDFKFPQGNIKPTLVISAIGRPSFDMEARKKLLKKAVTVPDIRWKRRDIKTTCLTAQGLSKQTAVDPGASSLRALARTSVVRRRRHLPRAFRRRR